MSEPERDRAAARRCHPASHASRMTDEVARLVLHADANMRIVRHPAGPPHSASLRSATVSLRLGHAPALTCHRHVIHSRSAASLPLKGEGFGTCVFCHFLSGLTACNESVSTSAHLPGRCTLTVTSNTHLRRRCRHIGERIVFPSERIRNRREACDSPVFSIGGFPKGGK